MRWVVALASRRQANHEGIIFLPLKAAVGRPPEADFAMLKVRRRPPDGLLKKRTAAECLRHSPYKK